MSRAKLALLLAIVAGAAVVGLSRSAAAHCDSVDGPVVKAGQEALDTGEVKHALAWVPKESEGELRTLFKKIVKAKKKNISAETIEMLERYFLETLVRLHRQGEGEPYTGIREAGATIDPGLVAADHAITAGSVSDLAAALAEDLAQGLRVRFKDVQKHRKWKTVAEGREYVHAYVRYIHYVEAVHSAIAGQDRADH